LSTIHGFNAEDVFRHFGKEDGYAKVLTSVLRLYTQLPDFDVSHAGLYAYFRSWRNTTDQDKLNTVWHSKDYMYAQTGLGRTAFNRKLSVLEKYELVTTLKHDHIPNKYVYYVHDPLPRDKFIEKYSEYVREFFDKVEEIEKQARGYRSELAERIARLNEQNNQKLSG
jgi:replication initiation and membrane attachment protein DnaB